MTDELKLTLGMPPKLAAAIAAVMGRVKTLAKDEQNKHGGFKFASVDDFYEAVRPLMAEAGLVIVSNEIECATLQTQAKSGAQTWLKMTYEFILAHTSGETWAVHPKRHILINSSMGSQAFGAAQSYADKNFLRALFRIATGEIDADAAMPETLPAQQGTRASTPSVSQQPVYLDVPTTKGGDPDWENWTAMFDGLLQDCQTADAVDALLQENADQLARLDRTDQAARKRTDDYASSMKAFLKGET